MNSACICRLKRALEKPSNCRTSSSELQSLVLYPDLNLGCEETLGGSLQFSNNAAKMVNSVCLAGSRQRTFVDRPVMENSMSTLARITGADFDAMVERGAFDVIGPRKVELIHGELRFMNPAGPVHDDHIEFVNDWSVRNTTRKDCNVRVQAGFVCQDNRPEPDLLWLRPKRYGRQRPTVADVLLLIEVSDSSLSDDLREKADLYSEGGVAEYWVVDIPNQRIHIMSDIHDGRYRRIEMHVAPDVIAPQCKPDARLMLAELFDI